LQNASNPLDVVRTEVARELARLTGLDPAFLFTALDRSSSADKGDLILAVPRLRIKNSAGRETPPGLAVRLASEFQVSNCPKVQQPVADGINIQFHLNPKTLPDLVLSTLFQQGEEYGLDPSLGQRDPLDSKAGKKTVIVEFSSPNIAKEFHLGHLRSTIIGAFLANLYEGNGYNVVRMNYLGDWGRQFGLLAVGWHRYGDADAFARDPIRELFRVYVKISRDLKPEEAAYKEAKKAGQDTAVLEAQGLLGESKAYFKRMEDGDEEALALWRQFRSLSIERYKATYARLNIEFSVYSGESEVKKETMERLLELLENRGVTEQDGGATIINFEKHGAKKLGTAILKNRFGASTYLLRDLGAAVQRAEEYQFDEMLYVVMSEQEGHLKWLFKTMELMGGPYADISKNMKHISFGKVKGMSTRNGSAVFLDDVLNDVRDFMHDVMRRNEAKYSVVSHPDRTASLLGLSAVMVQDMTGKRINNYAYDLGRMTSFEGDTGPYLQYAHARLCSVGRKAGYSHDELVNQAEFGLLVNEEGSAAHAVALLRAIARYPDMVRQAIKTLEPTTILTYLFQLAHELSSSYDHLRVVNPPEGRAVSLARAALYEAARQTLRNGMVLLGVTPVDRM